MTTVHAADSPSSEPVRLSYTDSFSRAFEMNPEYIIQAKRVSEERLRAGVARHQQMPEFNFTASYGYNGLGLTPATSWNTIETGNYPSWSLGLELHIPLAGNIKGRADYGAAKLALQESVANLANLQTQIANAVNTAILKARGWQESIQSYQTVVHFNEDLLKTQAARANAGTIEPRRVLEVEADLFDARQSLADALVQYQRTLLELELAEGSVLQRRNADLTKEELHKETLALLHNEAFPSDPYAPTHGMPSAAPGNTFKPLPNAPASVAP